MKKILFTAFAGIACFFSSCDSNTATTSESGKDSTQAKNIAAYETVSKAFQTGDVSNIDNVVADDFIDHTEKGEVKGKDSLKAMITMTHGNMKDSKMETTNIAASGDYVYAWMRYSGTGDGTMGMPNGPYDMNSIELVKFHNGKAVEHWNFMQAADMMKMMGPQPPMNNMNTEKKKMDSAATMK